MIEVCAALLSQRRLVHHSNCDVIVVAIESVMTVIPSQVKMLCRFYCDKGESRRYVKLRKEVKDQIYGLSKVHKTTAAGFINSIITIFFKATLASLWKNRQHNYNEIKNKFPQITLRKHTSNIKVKETRKLDVSTRKLKLKKDEIEMRHHNYMAEFRGYMDTLGGIDKWLNQNVLIMVHSKPLADRVGKPTELDTPKDSNPGAVHTVRIWKRGRGYNLTVLANHDSSYGEGYPELEPGTVYRLYDIYRNIDWLTIKLQ